MRRTLAAAGLAGALFLTGPVMAQQAQPAAAPGGGGEPIEITSDRLVLEQNQQVATFTGNVDAVQGETRLRSDKMLVFYTSNEAGQASGNKQSVSRIEAEGNVVITKPGETAQGDSGTYDLATRKLMLQGSVVLTRGENVVRGDRLDSDLATGVSTVSVSQPSTAAGKPDQRVRALFTPTPAPAPKAP